MRHLSYLSLWLALVVLALLPVSARAQGNDDWRTAWNWPVEPFRVVANIYYVGAENVTSLLIATPAGHIIVDGGFAETAPLICANVAKLGFRPEDVKILLSSHAHADHAGGLAELKRATGAKLYAGTSDTASLARGGKGDFRWGDSLPFPPVVADNTVGDGETVELGGVMLTAYLTPGHTRGNLTWTMRVEDGGQVLDVVFAGSMTAPGYKLVGNESYPEIAEDFARSFALLKTLPCDVFLAPHGHDFGLVEKRRRMEEGAEQNPFVDRKDYLEWVMRSEAALTVQIDKERAAAAGGDGAGTAVAK